MKKALFSLIVLAICVYQFGYSVKPAHAIYPSMGSLDYANNTTGGATNSSSAQADDPGLIVYGTWQNLPNGVSFASDGTDGIYVDNLFVQSYYPGWYSGTGIQFGVDDTSLPNGPHTVQLRANTNTYYSGGCSCYVADQYRTNILTFYVQHSAPPVTCTITIAGDLNNGNFSLGGTNNFNISGPSSVGGAYPTNTTFSVPGNATYNFAVTSGSPPSQSSPPGGPWRANYIYTTDSRTCNSSNSQQITFTIHAVTAPNLNVR
ncbi:MAG: hypothetical protein JWO40_63 [Candidatus Doudnabacteria bacterium]|nr:hypothetical protein [Candidatus Doudnabacteria bacterium]